MMGRIIAVGDRAQSIYGFRGAHSGAMDELQERFHMHELPLSISYRCPRAVVQKAKTWVPQIESHEAAQDGYVGEEGTDWAGQAALSLGAPIQTLPDGISKWKEIKDFSPSDVILCRLTRPLVALAFALLRERIPCSMLGRDIGQGLTNLVKRVLKHGHLSLQDALGAFETALEGFYASQRERLVRRQKNVELGRLQDQVATIRVFLGGGDGEISGKAGDVGASAAVASGETKTITDLIADVERMFVDNGQTRNGVVLSTVHKAKGLEWDRVFVLDAGELMPWKWARQDWELAQERNLMYVAATRSKRELRYVRSEELGVPSPNF